MWGVFLSGLTGFNLNPRVLTAHFGQAVPHKCLDQRLVIACIEQLKPLSCLIMESVKGNLLNERQLLGGTGMKNYAEMTSRERKCGHSYFRIWSNEWLNSSSDINNLKKNILCLYCNIFIICYIISNECMCLTREKKLKLKLPNSKCTDAVCETWLVNCSLGCLKGERVILQVQCRG